MKFKVTNFTIDDVEARGVLIVDAVITCFGWRFDDSWFDFPIKKTHEGKYPKIKKTFEADGIANLYFIGALSHSLDFRKTSGGFIHGFRHNIKALFNILQRREGVKWPSQEFHDVSGVVEHMFERINGAAGPYHMFGGGLMDGITISIRKSRIMFRYVYEVPRTLFHEWFTKFVRVEWYLDYGKYFYGPKVMGASNVGGQSVFNAHKSTFLHPRLHYYPASATQPNISYFLQENVKFQFNRAIDREAVTKMFRIIVTHLMSEEEQNKCRSQQDEIEDDL